MSNTCEIRITLSEEEHLAVRTEMLDCQEWAENAIRVRADIAAKNIVQKYVSKALENGWTIPSSRIEIIKDAYAKGVVKQVDNVIPGLIDEEESTPPA